MAPRRSTSSRRQPFSSVELAKEAGSNPTVVKKAGLRGLTKRHWIPAALIYGLSVAGSSVGFYIYGAEKAFDKGADLGFDICRSQFNGPPTVDPNDVYGAPGVFHDDFASHNLNEDVANNPHVAIGRPEGFWWDHKFETPDDEFYSEGEPERVSPVSTTLTKRKRDPPAPTAAPSEDVDEPAPFLDEGGNPIDSPEIEESGSDSEPDVIEDHVREESEVESEVESNSDFLNLARRSVGRRDDYYPPGPYAVGNQDNGFAGQGDRPTTHGTGRRPSIPESYVDNLEIPKSPQAHRVVVDTDRGGHRIADPYYPAPTQAPHVAQGAPPAVTGASQAVTGASQAVTGASQAVTGASQAVTGASQAVSGSVVTITLPFDPHATHVAHHPPAN